MINWIRQQFCKHNIEIVEDMEYIVLHRVGETRREVRKYMICTNCGMRKKISKK